MNNKKKRTNMKTQTTKKTKQIKLDLKLPLAQFRTQYFFFNIIKLTKVLIKKSFKIQFNV